MCSRLRGGNGKWDFYIPGPVGHQQSRAGTCAGYRPGAAAKTALLPASSARKWESPAPDSLLCIPLSSVPSSSHCHFQCSASSSTHNLTRTLPNASPGRGTCLQLSCKAGQHIKGTKPLTRPCPASAPLPLLPSLHHGK